MSFLSYFLWLENREDSAGGRLGGEATSRRQRGRRRQGWIWAGKHRAGSGWKRRRKTGLLDD
jgi:hypothetical protein